MAQEIFRKINVLETHSSLGYAGGQRNMITFAKNFRRDIFNVYVAGYREGGSQEQKLKFLKIDYVVSAGRADEILDFIRKKEIDVIHLHRSGGYVPLEAEIIKGAKKINPNIIILEKNVFGKFDPVCDDDIDCHMFQSMMHLNERYLPASGLVFDFKKMKVFYNMVDAEEFEKLRLTEKQIQEYKHKLGIEKDDFVIGRIARPDLAKWSDLIIEMMPYLIKAVSNLKFILIGVPPSRLELLNRPEFKKYFIILPPTSLESEVHAFYQAIDVLAHSSKAGECNGNTINEAMFWSKPVVINSTPRKDNGQLEQVEHLFNGLVANEPQTFARALDYLCKNPVHRKQLGDNGRQRVLIQNRPDFMTRRLEKVLLEKLIDSSHLAGLSEQNFYDRINHYPTERQIENFRLEYRRRLKWNFGKVSPGERVVNILAQPRGLYFKIKDFLEHRFKV